MTANTAYTPPDTMTLLSGSKRRLGMLAPSFLQTTVKTASFRLIESWMGCNQPTYADMGSYKGGPPSDLYLGTRDNGPKQIRSDQEAASASLGDALPSLRLSLPISCAFVTSDFTLWRLI